MSEKIMKKVMGFFGMVCISMLFLISLASCNDSSDKKLSLEIYKPYYETTNGALVLFRLPTVVETTNIV